VLAVVTGAGSGIGRVTATTMAGLGATVVAVDIDGDAAERAARDCGGHAYEVDTSDAAAMERLAGDVLGAHGVPHVVVNNAGVGMSGHFLDVSADDWSWIVGINLLGVVNGCRSFGAAMVERGSGHVVNVSSGLAYTPRSTESAYCATKAAVLSLSMSLSADWHDHGVGVTAICPGVINTAIIGHGRFVGSRSSDEFRHDVSRLFARGHDPRIVADAIVRGVERRRLVVPVGIEAVVGWFGRRLLPTRATARIARQQVRGV
jgi:NAD(P)-dependent dehydrogenase (short-subunit alcohol dehydrogenase family)